MKIKLPRVEPIDTLALPDDFEDRVKKSFAKFTRGTNTEYTYEDKLLYLDNLRTIYTRKITDSSDAVKNLILDCAEFELDEYGDLPDRDEFCSLEFLKMCYDAGKKLRFRDKYYEYNHHDNDTTMKVIAKIIQIVMNWESEEE